VKVLAHLSYGDHQPPPFDELFRQQRRQLRGGGRHYYAVERGLLRPAEIAVAESHGDISIAQ
jgi:hypothetical protein